MRKFGRNKIALLLFLLRFSGGKTSAMELNKVKTQNPQALEAVGGASSRSNQSVKQGLSKNQKLGIGAAAFLVVAAAASFTIWSLTRNKKESDTPKKEDDNKGNIKSEIQGEKSKKEINEQNNKDQITKEKEIEKHNKNLIYNAIELAKQGKKLHCDENLLRDAMFELFGRLANIKYEDKAWGVVSPLWKFFHEKKIPNISIGEYESENYVFLHTGEKHDYSIVWLPDNKVAIGFMDLGQNWEQTFENLKSPFEVKN